MCKVLLCRRTLPPSLCPSLAPSFAVSPFLVCFSLSLYIYINMEICAYTFVSNRLSQKNSMVDFRHMSRAPQAFVRV